MGLRIKVEGSESINLMENCITTFKFDTDIPLDSNARSTDLGSTVYVEGKILASVGGEAADDTAKLARWSLIPAENSDCYRNAEMVVVNASQIVRRITFPQAFLVGYEEDFSDDTGIGTFRLLMKQKKDKMTSLKLEGGFSAE